MGAIVTPNIKVSVKENEVSAAKKKLLIKNCLKITLRASLEPSEGIWMAFMAKHSNRTRYSCEKLER